MSNSAVTIDPETIAFLREACPPSIAATVAPVSLGLRVAATADVAVEGVVHLGRYPLKVATEAQSDEAMLASSGLSAEAKAKDASDNGSDGSDGGSNQFDLFEVARLAAAWSCPFQAAIKFRNFDEKTDGDLTFQTFSKQSKLLTSEIGSDIQGGDDQRTRRLVIKSLALLRSFEKALLGGQQARAATGDTGALMAGAAAYATHAFDADGAEITREMVADLIACMSDDGAAPKAMMTAPAIYQAALREPVRGVQGQSNISSPVDGVLIYDPADLELVILEPMVAGNDEICGALTVFTVTLTAALKVSPGAKIGLIRNVTSSWKPPTTLPPAQVQEG